MALFEWCFVILCTSLLIATRCDDRIYFKEEDESRRNVPPELTSSSIGKSAAKTNLAQPRFLPFSASFSVSNGGNNAQSLSIGGSPNGISVSHAASQSDRLSSFGNSGSLSTSQSSSFSAGLSGIASSGSNSFNLNHPVFGGTSQTSSNSFAVGQATALSQGHLVNGQSISSAQTSAGSSLSAASSGASHVSNIGHGFSTTNSGLLHTDHRQGRPTWVNVPPNYASQYPGYNSHQSLPTLSVYERPHGWPHGYKTYRDPVRLQVDVHDSHVGTHRVRPEVQVSNGWYQQSPGFQQPWRASNCDRFNPKFADPRCRVRVTVSKPGSFSTWSGNDADQIFQPSENVQSTAASVEAITASTGSGFALAQSNSQSSYGLNGPTSINRYDTLQNASNDKFDANYGTGTVENTQAIGTLVAGNSVTGNNNSRSDEKQSNQNGHGQTTGLSAGSTSYVQFTDGRESSDERVQTIPEEFIRSNFPKNSENKKGRQYNPVEELLTDITDTVVELFNN